MDAIILIVKGFIIGVAKIVPGVSGALLAMTLGLYEDALAAISHFWRKPKTYIPFLTCLGFGVLLAIILGSNIIRFFLSTFYLPTMLFFIGLMLGGIPSFYREIKEKRKKLSSKLCFLIPFLIVLFLSFQFQSSTVLNLSKATPILLFVMGLIEVATTMIPGVSGTAIFMLIGCYPLLLELFSMLGSLEQMVRYSYLLIPFGIGILCGLFLIAKMMTILFHKCYYGINYCILGFSTASIVTLFLQTMENNYSILEIVISIFLLTIGYKLAKLF